MNDKRVRGVKAETTVKDPAVAAAAKAEAAAAEPVAPADGAAPAGDAPAKKPRKPRAVDTQENIHAVVDAFMTVRDQVASLEICRDDYQTSGNDGNKLRDFMKTHRAALTSLAALDSLVVKIVSKTFLFAFVEKAKAIRVSVMEMHEAVVESF